MNQRIGLIVTTTAVQTSQNEWLVKSRWANRGQKIRQQSSDKIFMLEP